MTAIAASAATVTSVVPGAVALVGLTASGKSAAAHDLARRAAGPDEARSVELLSVDSMAVYREMDIGTDKPDRAARQEVRYHLLDLVDPSEDFSVADFQAAAATARAGIAARGHHSLLVGGTGLYLRAVTDGLDIPARFPDVATELEAGLDAAGPAGHPSRGRQLAVLHARLASLDPDSAARMEPSNERRILRALEVTLGAGRPFSSFGPGLARYPAIDVTLVGIRPELSSLDRRIADRLERQMDTGLLDEVRALATRPRGLSRTARQALGYRELLSHLRGEASLSDALDETARRTRSFARRQWAWFRRDPRIEWVDSADEAVTRILGLLAAGGDHPVGDWDDR